jgi:uncharacterized protein YkwD
MPGRLAVTLTITRRRLAAVAGLAFGLALAGTVLGAAPPAPWAVETFDPASETQLLLLTNQSRTDAGVTPLDVDAQLAEIARWRSRDMADRHYFSHSIPPLGGKVFEVIQARHYCFVLAGENIGWNTYPDAVATAEIQLAFLQSPGHRANVLSSRWQVLGVGAFKGSDGRKLWTVLFAEPCPPSGRGS